MIFHTLILFIVAADVSLSEANALNASRSAHLKTKQPDVGILRAPRKLSK